MGTPLICTKDNRIIAEKNGKYNLDLLSAHWYSGFYKRKEVIAVHRKEKLLVYLALLTSLCTVATMAIPIPTPTGGYLNAGDIVVVLTALLAGPLYGGIVSSLGAAAADLFAGYVIYAPGTLLAKGLAAMVTGLVFRLFRKKTIISTTGSAICGELLMAAVYFVYEALALGFGLGAAVEIPGNLLQGAAGVAGGALIYHALIRIPEIREFAALAQPKRKP